MRYLRLYSQDASFKADEINAGGTGNDVEAMVPCIVKTADLKKMYFNPHDKTVQFHTLTIYYENSKGEQLAECKTMRIKYIPGVTQEIVVTPKNIDGYIAKEEKIIANIPEDTSIVFRYKLKLDYNKPLTFNIISAGTIYWAAYSNSNQKTIQYKKNDGNWISIISTSTGTSINVTQGDIVQFRGDNATYAKSFEQYNLFSGSTTLKVEIEGNIMSLIKSKNFSTATTLESNFAFCDLFKNFISLISAKNLILPATTLANYCYSHMFADCTSLTKAPELPATILAENCYLDMFRGCTSLTTAPELPATTLTKNCYSNMFNSCTSLTSAPMLPATTLANSCYLSMFSTCTNLTAAPELPATTLASNSYMNMFNGCTSLTTAPALPATTLANSCYVSMFSKCTSLTTAPELPATTLVERCYDSMFEGCTSLNNAPVLPATTLATSCYSSMFSGCTSLTTAPVLPATTLATSCYRYMFQDCTSLNYIKCLATDISASNCTTNWTKGVAATGTFVKNPNMSSWGISTNGIPANWIVYDLGINLPVKNIYTKQNANTVEINIAAFSNWSALTNDSWITFLKNTGTEEDTKFVFTVSSTNEPRNGTIVFTSIYNEVTLMVGQTDEVFKPLTFNITSAGSFFWKANKATHTTTIEYSLDSGETWTSITSNTGTSAPSISVNAGDVVQFRGNNATYATGGSIDNTFSGSTARFEVEGNIMSLINSTNFATATTLASSYTFNYLFYDCTGLTSAENLVLPATALANYCYYGMFQRCTSLTKAPELPATTLANSCYYAMFRNCTSLTAAPSILPATKLTNYCYRYMFDGCTSLTTAPELPATTLASYCYMGMFQGCTSLTSAPKLPAITLAYGCYIGMFQSCTSLTAAPSILPAAKLETYCYQSMFQGCTSLTTAPKLPATTLADSCYWYMFYGCTNLNYIKCFATNISAYNCTDNWVNGVASIGTFVKNPNMSSWPTGINGIPSGWTVQDAS